MPAIERRDIRQVEGKFISLAEKENVLMANKVGVGANKFDAAKDTLCISILTRVAK